MTRIPRLSGEDIIKTIAFNNLVMPFTRNAVTLSTANLRPSPDSLRAFDVLWVTIALRDYARDALRAEPHLAR